MLFVFGVGVGFAFAQLFHALNDFIVNVVLGRHVKNLRKEAD